MKKFFLSITALLLIAILGTLFALPYVLGFVAEKKYQQLISTLTKSGAVNISLTDYQRGWFSSEATIKIQLPNSFAKLHPGTADTLIVKDHIQHGPILSATTTNNEKHILLGLALITSHLNSTMGIMDAMAWIKLDGSISGKAAAPSIHYQNTAQAQDMVINGLTGTFAVSTNFKQLRANFTVPEIITKTPKLAQHIMQMNMQYQLQKSASGLFLGQHLITVANIDWQAANYPAKISLNHFTLQSQDQEQNNKINADFSVQLEQLNLSNASYGPQSLLLSINNLDAATFLAAKKQLATLQNSNESVTGNFLQYQRILLALLNKGLEIQIKKLNVVTPWGNPTVVADIAFPPQPSATANWISVLRSANVNARATTPATFLVHLLEKIYGPNQIATPTPPASYQPGNGSILMLAAQPASPLTAQQKITEWVNKKWLLPKDNGFEINFFYQNQQTTINGQPLNMTDTTNGKMNLSNNQICKDAPRLS